MGFLPPSKAKNKILGILSPSVVCHNANLYLLESQVYLTQMVGDGGNESHPEPQYFYRSLHFFMFLVIGLFLIDNFWVHIYLP